MNHLLILLCLVSLITNAENKKEQNKAQEIKTVKDLIEKGKSEGKTKSKDAEICELPKSDAELRKLLSPEQYEVLKKNGTERPFANKYWDNKHPGIYTDLISKEALFSSKDKFDSGTGWPSFSKPIVEKRVAEKTDSSHGANRIEVRSVVSDSHLGHVFDDGPKETGGLRFCINSAALNFVPLEKLEEKGYEKYLNLFDKKDWEKASKNPYKE